MGLLGQWCATHPHSPGSGFQLYRGEAGPDVEGAPSWQVRGSESLWGPGRQRIAQSWERSNPIPCLGSIRKWRPGPDAGGTLGMQAAALVTF